MGSLIGHVLPGLGFFLLGLWHLFNHIKLYNLQPNSYRSSPWFPIAKLRYFELFFIMIGSAISVSMELFIGPSRHQPLDLDGTIPSNHLRNFEHASISMSMFVYSVFAIFLDRIGPPQAQSDLAQLLATVIFSEEYFLFHFHSTDHMGVEGQYHLTLQIVIIVSLVTTLMGIGYPKSFLISFVRSVSILSQGVWFIIMGYMLWTPGLIPKGCFINFEDGHEIVRCSNVEALSRAKSLVNIQFSWFVIAISISSVSFYLALIRIYGNNVRYSQLGKEFVEIHEVMCDVQTQKKNKLEDYTESSFVPLEMEREKIYL